MTLFVKWLGVIATFLFFTVASLSLSQACFAQNTQRGALSKSALKTLLLTGQVESIKSQAIMVPKAGDNWRYQIQWLLPEGTLAKPGQIVAIFDKSQIANQIEQLEANVLRGNALEQSGSIDLKTAILQAEFDVKKARLELAKAQLDADVAAEYIAAKTYADNQFKRLKAASELKKKQQLLRDAQFKQKASSAQLLIDKKKAQLELDQALAGLKQLEIRAQISGPVLYGRDPWSQKKYAVGDTVQVGRQIAQIPAMDHLQVVAWVNEVDADKLHLSQAVKLRLDAAIGQVFTGTIGYIGRQATKQAAWGNSNWFRVEVKLDKAKGVTLSPGMSVLVQPLPPLDAPVKNDESIAVTEGKIHE